MDWYLYDIEVLAITVGISTWIKTPTPVPALAAQILKHQHQNGVIGRCILHHYLGGHRSVPELNFAESNFEELYNVQWIKGCAAAGVCLLGERKGY